MRSTLGGQLLANGMGLGLAFNIDPLRGVETPALGQLYVVLGTLTFIALDGHIALIETLVASFRGLPVGPAGFSPQALRSLADWGDQMFMGAVRIALPGMTALMVINLAFGVTSRAAPSLNSVRVSGLPVTLGKSGLVVIWLGLPSTWQSGLASDLPELAHSSSCARSAAPARSSGVWPRTMTMIASAP